MILTSLKFFALLCVSLLLYYTLRKKQKYVLLITSLVFFFIASKGKELYMTAILLFVCFVTYGGGIMIQHFHKHQKKILPEFTATLAIIILVANLVVLKYLFNIGTMILSAVQSKADLTFLDFAAPIGLSYFSLNAIGYLLDVYWQSYEAEKNPCDVTLFISYFPAIVSGPVTRFQEMRGQFNEIHMPDYDGFTHGARRMIFGYMKKLVVADRLGQVVQIIYQNYSEQSGAMLLFGVMCYAFQLYADFSGCMDIISGSSRLYGITLPENFDAPFFSRTLPEFWRRWHISLGNWFRDYVMYPVLKTNGFQKLGKRAKKLLGKTYGKKIPTYLSTVILWAFIGIWHGGTGYYFMASAILPGVLLILSDLTEPFFAKLTAILKIRTESVIWHIFQSLRTFCIMLVCWIFVCTQEIGAGFSVIGRIFTQFQASVFLRDWSLLNLPPQRLLPLLLGSAIMCAADFLQNRKTSLHALVDRTPFFARTALVYAELALVLLFGLVGQSSFIYFKF